MGFFDTLGKKATEAYNVTTKKTGELAKEAKLRMKINENKSNINDLYKEIGKKVYEKHVRQENIDIKADLEEECAKIDILSSEIESCLTSILELKVMQKSMKMQYFVQNVVKNNLKLKLKKQKLLQKI